MTATDGPIGWLTQPPSDITSATPTAAVLILSPQPLCNFDAARGSCLMGSASFHCLPNLPFAAALNLDSILGFSGSSCQSSVCARLRPNQYERPDCEQN